MTIWRDKKERPVLGNIVVEHFRESEPSAYAMYIARGGVQTGPWAYLEDLLRLEDENRLLKEQNNNCMKLLREQEEELFYLKAKYESK